MPNTEIQIRIVGEREFLLLLAKKQRELMGRTRQALLESVVGMRARIVGSFGMPGKPKRQTGRLSRSIRAQVERIAGGWEGRVGVAAVVPYARILEYGGQIPEHIVRPVRKRALRWETGVTRLAALVGLEMGLTRRQASYKGRKGKKDIYDPEEEVFARWARIPARYQQAMPYVGPAVMAEKGATLDRIRAAVAAALVG